MGELTERGEAMMAGLHTLDDEPAAPTADAGTDQTSARGNSPDAQSERETADNPSAVSRETRVDVTGEPAGDEPAEGENETS